ncbi:MAG: hypothetical protein ACR5K4_02255 [Sodalis sp. (in: enterobacteria)]
MKITTQLLQGHHLTDPVITGIALEDMNQCRMAQRFLYRYLSIGANDLI